MTPPALRSLGAFVDALAEARAHEAKAKALEAAALKSLATALAEQADAPSPLASPTLLSPTAFARAYGMSRSLVYRLIKDGRLPVREVTRRKRLVLVEAALDALGAPRSGEDAPPAHDEREAPVVDARRVRRAAQRSMALRVCR